MKSITITLKILYQLAGAELAIFMLLFLGISCVPGAPAAETNTDLQQARLVLEAYLKALAEEDYTTASNIYAGGTDFLQQANPELDPQDTPQLLRNGCRINGLQCLPLRAIGEGQQLAPDLYVYDVQFNTRAGNLFERGPCCGASEAEMPTQSIFTFKVQKQDQAYKVLDLPPYVP